MQRGSQLYGDPTLSIRFRFWRCFKRDGLVKLVTDTEWPRSENRLTLRAVIFTRRYFYAPFRRNLPGFAFRTTYREPRYLRDTDLRAIKRAGPGFGISFSSATHVADDHVRKPRLGESPIIDNEHETRDARCEAPSRSDCTVASNCDDVKQVFRINRGFAPN